MKSIGRSLLVCVAITLVNAPVLTPGADTAPGTAATLTNADDVARSYQRIQEQIIATQQAIERNRQDAENAAARNAETLAGRLQGIEQSLAAQRARDLEAIQSSNRVLLIVAGTFAAMGLLVMLLIGYFQWRAANRLAEITTGIPPSHALGPGTALAALGPANARLVGPGPAQQSNMRLLGALERLENRIRELEQTGHSASASEEHYHTAEDTLPPSVSTRSNGDESATVAAQPSSGGNAARVTMLLGKGQSLLSLDKANEALACLNEALSLHPAHAEALVKKGAALERLGQLEEAAACYDQAIQADRSLTMAYLYKGGLYNRLERFGEALECYEQALENQGRANRKS